MNIEIKKSYDELSRFAALEIKKLIDEKPNCVLGLATGSTPIGLYKELVKLHKEGEIDFSKITTFNLDEYRGLDGDHNQSYRYFMDDNLFNHINIDKNNTFVPNGVAQDVDDECKKYEELMEEKGGVDIQVLGIGVNGHIGFNEPNKHLYMDTHIEDLTDETISSNLRFFSSREEMPTQAITMGIGSIMKAKRIILLISGKNKADIVAKLFSGKITTELPASILQIHNNCTVVLDEEAASLLNK
ncbi:glucosamine-6-phosphate deaminase [Clostridium sp. MSJ-11]|uniref:Glucosamine-6-phosphate deaminase n=1 Tax=Clostridium mobile TaxID=2841512 RepID=A0ABS6EJP3_9CLOT|nr:glucosamine-6-phosphate deaminase [Clostridium mobile]MBU5485002.1 glucosamine-6-phosphate deaminase [Clostridium mobile]